MPETGFSCFRHITRRWFERCLPLALRQPGSGFRAKGFGQTAVFHGLTDDSVVAIQSFLAFYERAVCLSPAKPIRDLFGKDADGAPTASGTDERRWVEGVLARKKGLGL